MLRRIRVNMPQYAARPGASDGLARPRRAVRCFALRYGTESGVNAALMFIYD